MPTLDIEAEPNGAAYVVRLRGELDLAGCPDLEMALSQAVHSQSDPILVDLEELSFIDGAGLESLLVVGRQAASNGDRLRITQGAGQVARLFHLTAVDRTLPLVAAEGF